MLHLKAMKWYHSAKMYLQQITERIQESFGGSEMIFPAHFTVKHPYLFLYYSCTWTPKFIATSSPMRRICLLHSFFNKCLELPWSALSSTNKEMLNSFSTLVSILFFLLRATAFDFCKVKRGKDGGTLRTMSGEKLLKTLPVLQAQVIIVVDITWLFQTILPITGGCVAGIWLFSPRPQQRGHQLQFHAAL